MTRTALILETNPVITERYLDYTNESDWRIMLKDTLNDFLEKLQHEQFDLIVAEESILPQAIIHMLKSIGIPFILSTNTQNPEIPTLPRNFNRTELLTVFDRLVPKKQDETTAENTAKEDAAVNELLSGLEDEEETFELTSDSVILDPGKQSGEEKKAEGNTPGDTLFEDENTQLDTLFEDEKTLKAPVTAPFDTSESDDDADFLFGDEKKDEEFRPEVTLVSKPSPDEPDEEEFEKTAVQEEPAEPEETAEEEPVTPGSTPEAEISDDDPVKAAVKEWLDKNARSIIKEIVLEQLLSLSGKNND